METETPRVDAEVAPNDPTGTPGAYVDADFARTLERELTQAKSEVERLKKANRGIVEQRDEAQSALATARAQLLQTGQTLDSTTKRLEHTQNAGVLLTQEADSLRSRLAEAERAYAENVELAAKQGDEIDSLRAQLEAVTKERDDYRQMTHQAEDYITKIGNLLGCADGDDAPEIRIKAITTALVAAEKELTKLRGIRDTWMPCMYGEGVDRASLEESEIERCECKWCRDALVAFRAQQPQGGGKEA